MTVFVVFFILLQIVVLFLHSCLDILMSCIYLYIMDFLFFPLLFCRNSFYQNLQDQRFVFIK